MKRIQDCCCSLLLVIGSVILPPILCAPAAAAQIRAIDPPKTSNAASRGRVEIVGTIVNGDAAKLPKLLVLAKENSHSADQGLPSFYHRPVVLLDSPGGDVQEAMRIGRMLRNSFAWVIVPSGATCASACVLILAGGSSRDVFGPPNERISKAGVHGISIRDPRFTGMTPQRAISEYNVIRAQVRSYLDEMGTSSNLFERMFGVGSEDIYWIPRAELETWQLTSDDPGYREWLRNKEIDYHGEIYIKARDRYIKCLNDGGKDAECLQSSGWNQ